MLSKSPRIKPSITTSYSKSQRVKDEMDHIPNDFLKSIRKNIKKHKSSKILTFVYSNGKKEKTKYDKKTNTYTIYSPNHIDVDFTLKVLKSEGCAYLLLDDMLLGEGANGRVVKAVDLLNDDNIVACKIAKHWGSEHDYNEILQEIENLAILERFLGHHTHKEFDECNHDDAYYEYILMDFYPGTSLKEFLYQVDGQEYEGVNHYTKNEISFLHLARVCCSIITEIMYIHDHGLVFRDIKPENFMYYQGTHPNDYKLSSVDLGSAIPFDDALNMTSLDGTTHGYVAPELTPSSQSPGFSILQDYFSLGVILAEILTENVYPNELTHKYNQILEVETFKRELRKDEIVELLPDIFDINIDIDIDNVQNSISNRDKIKHSLIMLVNDLTAVDPSERPNPEELKARLDTIQGLIRKETFERTYSTGDFKTRIENSLKEYKENKTKKKIKERKPKGKSDQLNNLDFTKAANVNNMKGRKNRRRIKKEKEIAQNLNDELSIEKTTELLSSLSISGNENTSSISNEELSRSLTEASPTITHQFERHSSSSSLNKNDSSEALTTKVKRNKQSDN